MKEIKPINNRIYYLDYLRVIACIFVITIHTSAQYVVKDIGSFNFWIGNFLDSIARSGVPIFIMISGALMLDETYKYSKKKMIKHIRKMILFFIFWSIVYYVVFNIIEWVIINNGYVNIINDVVYIIKGHYHLWFIYLIIGLYLIVPLLRLWVKEKNKKYVEYFIILSVIFTYIIPQILGIGSYYNHIFEELNSIIENYLHLKYVGGYTTYFILGWYIHNYDLKSKRIIYMLGIIGFIITFVGTYILSVSNAKPIQMYENLSLNVLLQSTAVYVFIKSNYYNKYNMDNKFINLLSKYSLGIYGIHVLIINLTYKILLKFNQNNAIINVPAVIIITIAISFFTTLLFSKIPVLKKIV